MQNTYLHALFEAKARKAAPLEERDLKDLARIKKPSLRREWIDTRAGDHHCPMATALRLAVYPHQALENAIRHDSPEVFEHLGRMGILPASDVQAQSLFDRAMGGTGYWARTVYPFSVWTIFSLMSSKQQIDLFERVLDRTSNKILISDGVIRRHSLKLDQKFSMAEQRENRTAVVSILLPPLFPTREKVNVADFSRLVEICTKILGQHVFYDTEKIFQQIKERDSDLAAAITAAQVARRIEIANRPKTHPT